MLRGEDRLLGRQPEGEEVDVDALVEAAGDRASRRRARRRACSASRIRNERSLAAMFMVDMSGSTKGWVNDAERESLVMLCEALETLGDAYAIYGFSGWTRTRCDIYPVKRFDEALRHRGARPHRRHRGEGLHAHGRRHPPPDATAGSAAGAAQAAGFTFGRAARRLRRRVSRPLRHRGHAPRPAGGARAAA
jgi:hypothetical protein